MKCLNDVKKRSLLKYVMDSYEFKIGWDGLE